MESTGIYWAAMALHPGYGLRWIELHLPHRVHAICQEVRDLLNEDYPAEDPSDNPFDQSQRPEVLNLYLITPDFYKTTTQFIPLDQLTEYLKLVPTPVKAENLFSWWTTWKLQFPQLSKLALDLLSIPVMSSENERAFS